MILGIWDGHDAGAAIIDGCEIKIAVNEERFTNRKLDVGFPKNSIKACLDFLNLKPEDIKYIGVSTSDFSKTMTRAIPSLKDKYYLLRRRKIHPRFAQKQKNLKYRLTEIGTNFATKKISERIIKKELNKMDFKNYKLIIVDHHMAHAATAGFCSNFDKKLVITIDGVGDGLSGTINIFEKDKIEKISEISAKNSLGIFFEHVTNLLSMRELEDEGKVMALSDYAYPLSNNKMLDFFEVQNLNIKAKYSSTILWEELRKILWSTTPEQFAYMAQETLEDKLLTLFQNALHETGLKNVAWSGGVASNIKANMKIRKLPEVDKWFVFPHMGDGGLAVGAAMLVNYELNGVHTYKFDDLYFGTEYNEETIEKYLKKNKLKYNYEKNIGKHVGDLITDKNIVFLYQGRMEFGPRALGNRSILASASSIDLKNKLNIMIKQRSWYQPFCPSLLLEDAKEIFEDYDYPEKFMTMGFIVKKEYRKDMASVINIDGSARPQMLSDENQRYKEILKQVKKQTGLSAILNTSFNQHGYPIVNTPEDAITVMKKTKNKFMVMQNFVIEM